MSSSRGWGKQIEHALLEALAAMEAQPSAVLDAAGHPPCASQDATLAARQAAARDCVLEALYRKWALLPCSLGSRTPGCDRIVELLPDPPETGGHGLYTAKSLFAFATCAESLMDLEIERLPSRFQVATTRRRRKEGGIFFTPYEVAAYMTASCLAPQIDRRRCEGTDPLKIRVFDPAAGTGRFLLAAAEYLVRDGDPATRGAELALRRQVAARCLFGIERNAFALRAARCLLGLYTVEQDNACRLNLCEGDALADGEPRSSLSRVNAPRAARVVPDGSGSAGFDVIVGNPPYVAQKNTPRSFLAASRQRFGQNDLYLLFIEKFVSKKYLARGGRVSFVVPDPLLCRGNARQARERLLGEVDLETLVHAYSLFEGASVANVIFIAGRPALALEAHVGSTAGVACAREGLQRIDSCAEHDGTITVWRLKNRAAGEAFLRTELDQGFDHTRRPSTSTPTPTRRRGDGSGAHRVLRELFARAAETEFRYLLAGPGRRIVGLLDPVRPRLRCEGVAIRSLPELVGSRGAIFRGEEIGKQALRGLAGESGAEDRMPALIGGESIARYTIKRAASGALSIPQGRIHKDLRRYQRPKIIVQKSTQKLVAALDRRGFVFPQSVYGIMLDTIPDDGYLVLAQLNSRLLNFYLFAMFTGYKLLQPQIEVEDLKRLPILWPAGAVSRRVRQRTRSRAREILPALLSDDSSLQVSTRSLRKGMMRRLGAPDLEVIFALIDLLARERVAAGAAPDRCAAAGSRVSAERIERIERMIDLLIYELSGLGDEEVAALEAFGEGGAGASFPGRLKSTCRGSSTNKGSEKK